MMHHAVAGLADAPVLVLSNSLGTNIAMWDPQLEALSEHLRVVRYDTRGHGASPVPPGPYTLETIGHDVIELLDHLEVECASLCGVSLGGMVGMWLGVNAPERIDRLVLCCTSAWLPPAQAWADRAAAVRAASSTEVVADAVLSRWLTPAGVAADPERSAWLREMLLATPAEGYAGCCAVIEHLDLRDDVATITAPTLVIGGAQDAATPPEHQRAIVERISGARLELLDGAAHLANLEQPHALNALVLEHLGSVAGRHA